MKILIPNYSPPDSFVDNVSYTLKKMGHQVINMGMLSNQLMNSPYWKLFKDVAGKILGKTSTKQELWLLRMIKIHNPQVVLTLTQALSPEVLALLKKNKIITICWWGDTPANMKGNGLLVDGWDLIYIKDKFAVNKLRGLGLNALYQLEALNPDWHKPLAKQNNHNVVIAGSFYDYRHFLTKKLIADNINVELYGGRLPFWADPIVKKAHSKKFIVKEEKSMIFGSGLAVLNSTAMSEFDSINCRAFEIAGAAGLQIMEYRPALEECFEIDKEILVYRHYDELIALLDKAKRFPKEMEKIRQNGLKRALAEHTYTHRLQKILNDISQL